MELKPEIRYLPLPEVSGEPVRKLVVEIRVVLLPCAPRKEVEHPHGAERFDEAERPFVETAEEAVAFQEGVDERTALAWFVRKQHPEILHGRADDHVVEIDQMKPFVRTVQNVEIVAVAMDADELHIVRKGADACVDHVFGDVQKLEAGIERNGFRFLQIVEIVDGCPGGMEDAAVAGLRLFADGVDTA